MKKKEIFLDFTPLLDVTLIILFFFILFSSLEVVEQKDILEQQNKKVQAELAAQEAELQDALDILESESDRRANNVRGMMDFGRGSNIKIILDLNENATSLRVLRAGEVLSVLAPSEDLSGSLGQALQQSGYSQKDTIFCDFVLDGSQPGSASAYRSIKKSLSELRQQFPYFYYSETDTSIGKD